MSKLGSIVFGLATVSLFIALFTHPALGNSEAVWMVAPVLVFGPYGMIKTMLEWMEGKK